MSEPTRPESGPRGLPPAAFHVVVVSGRPTVTAFFGAIAATSGDSVDVSFVAVDARVVAEERVLLATATVAVVDASVDSTEALGVCGALRAEHPDLPVGAMFCCPQSVAAADLRALLAAGVGSILDLQLSAEETVRVLRAFARGRGAFHLPTGTPSSGALFGLMPEPPAVDLSESDLGLLKLVALGLTDHEIGRNLFLSHHTVKHRIDRLRRRVHARNRVQLAAWAGGHDALRGDRDPGRADGGSLAVRAG